VIDEFDVERFDERAARWWLDRNPEHDGDPAAIVRHHREHLHPVARIVAELSATFDLGPPVRGPYLYRWGLGPELRAEEERSIAAGELPETGVRLVGSKRLARSPACAAGGCRRPPGKDAAGDASS
jgi:hypothetical protein